MIEPPLVIVGGGGHARVLISELRLLNFEITGVLDPNLHVDQTVSGVNVIGSDDKLSDFEPTDVRLVNGIGRLPRYCRRSRLLEKGIGKSFTYAKVLSRNAIIHEDVEIGEGAQVLSGAVVQTGVVLGRHSVVNTNSSLDHDCEVGANVWISPGVTVCGGVTLEENVFLGAGVVVLPGCVIESNTVIRAGTLVTR